MFKVELIPSNHPHVSTHSTIREYPALGVATLTIPAHYSMCERVKVVQQCRKAGMKLENFWLHLGQANFTLEWKAGQGWQLTTPTPTKRG